MESFKKKSKKYEEVVKPISKTLRCEQQTIKLYKSELKRLKKEIEYKNNAINILKEKGKNIDIEQKIAVIIRSKVIPLVEKLKKNKIFEYNTIEIDMLSAYLNDLTSVLTNSAKVLITLSQTELQIAAMIKNGLSSGEISKQLCISEHTVKTHRKNIRKKLNLINTGVNLHTFLKSKMQ